MVRTRRAARQAVPSPPSTSPQMLSTAAASKKSVAKKSVAQRSTPVKKSAVTIKDRRANRRKDPSPEPSPPPEPANVPEATRVNVAGRTAARRLTDSLRVAPSRRPTRPSPVMRSATPDTPIAADEQEEEDDAASLIESLPPATTASPTRPMSRRGRSSSRRLSTPPIASNPDSDLYGLSPSGEISRARIEERQRGESRRASLAQPQSALKAQGTPAVETSILALGRFKRRKRQPSVIRLVQLEAEAQAAVGEPTDSELDLDLDMGDFNPEDESTPLHLTSTRRVLDRPSSSRKRKRDSSEVEQGMPSSPPTAPPSKLLAIGSELSSSGLSELSSIGLAEDPEQPHARFAPVEPEDGEPMSETMAPPLSSSSETSPAPAQEAPRPRRGERRGPEYLLTETLTSLLPRSRHRPILDLEHDTAESSSQRASELESPDATEVPSSPPRPAPRRATRAGAAATAAAKSRATARTTRAATSAAPAAKRTRTAEAAAPSGTLPRGKTRGRAPLGERRDAMNAPVQKRGAGGAGGKLPAGATALKAKRTHASKRGPAADKENDADNTFRLTDSTDSIETPVVVSKAKGKGKDPAPKKQSEEMERLKKKFAEVDAWEMDYESVDMGGTSSSWR